jgi:hypothetical protein
MNKDYVLWNLKEAAEELAKIIAEVEAAPEDEDLEVADFGHLYHHINTAWNAREATKEETDECSEANFYLWRRFPDDLIANFTGTPDEE